VDAAGYVYVTAHANQLIHKYTSDGKLIAKWGINGQTFNLTDIAVDDEGRVYATDPGRNLVRIFEYVD